MLARVFATRTVIDRYRSVGKNVVVLGSTGISAVNIGGVTIHSFLALGFVKILVNLLDMIKVGVLKKVS